MLEIDVDIGRLVARLGDETLEHHGADFGADRGHAKAIAHHRIRRRPAPLAQDAARAGKGDDVIHGQEIGLVAQLADQAQFVLEQGPHMLGGAAGIAPLQSLKRQTAQAACGAFAFCDLAGIFMAQLIQRKGQPRGKRACACHGVAVPLEKTVHFSARAQPPFGIAQGVAAKIINPCAQPDRAEHIRHPSPVPAMHERHPRGERGQVEILREPGQPVKAGRVLPVIKRGEDKVHIPAKAARQPFRLWPPVIRAARRLVRLWRVQQKVKSRGPRQQIVKAQLALALFGAQPPEAEQAAQAGPARTIIGQGG